MENVYVLILTKNGKDTVVGVYTNEYDANWDATQYNEKDKHNGYYGNYYRVDEYPLHDTHQTEMSEDSKYDE